MTNKVKQTTSKNSIGLGTLIFLIFLIMKLAEIGTVATWSWWWVTSPLWIPISLIIFIFAISFLIFYIKNK